jgi:hypothetical protein
MTGALPVKSVYVPAGLLAQGKPPSVMPAGQKSLCCKSTYSTESAMVNPQPMVLPGVPEIAPPTGSKVTEVLLAARIMAVERLFTQTLTDGAPRRLYLRGR